MGDVRIGFGGGLVGERKPGLKDCCGEVALHLVSSWSDLTGVVTGLVGIGGRG